MELKDYIVSAAGSRAMIGRHNDFKIPKRFDDAFVFVYEECQQRVEIIATQQITLHVQTI